MNEVPRPPYIRLYDHVRRSGEKIPRVRSKDPLIRQHFPMALDLFDDPNSVKLLNGKIYTNNLIHNIDYGRVLDEAANMTYELLLQLILQDHNGFIRRNPSSKEKIMELRNIYPSLSSFTLDVLTLENHDMITFLLSRYSLLEQPGIHQFIYNQHLNSEPVQESIKSELVYRVDVSIARYDAILEIFPYFSQFTHACLDE